MELGGKEQKIKIKTDCAHTKPSVACTFPNEEGTGPEVGYRMQHSKSLKKNVNTVREMAKVLQRGFLLTRTKQLKFGPNIQEDYRLRVSNP